MTFQTADTLVIVPSGSPYSDYSALYAIATAYAHSGLIISDHGQRASRLEFSFPAIVCSSFAIELFLKFFLMLGKLEGTKFPEKHKTGHHLHNLWEKICPEHQALIAGMFRNKTGIPLLNASDRRIELFIEALDQVGESPFVKWRYVHELISPTLMSHAAINEVLDALRNAASYVMNEKSEMRQTPKEAAIPPNQAGESDYDALASVCGSNRLLLGRDSVLRQIPINVDPKQAIFLDGIRHAVEIMDIAYNRLRDTLTNLALVPPVSDELPDISAHVFLDAWGFVDAVDRFRILYTKMPSMRPVAAKGSIPTLREVTQEFRNLRNVADHLAQRVDLVVSRNGAALGELTWLTGFQLQPEVIAWHCTLRPGTLRSVPSMQTDPIFSTLDWPTDSIRLSAGGYEGNLSAVRAHIAIRIKHLEAQLQGIFRQPSQAHVPVINDCFMRRPVKRKGNE